MTAQPVCAGNPRNKSDISLLSVNFWNIAFFLPPTFWKKHYFHGLRRIEILRTAGRKVYKGWSTGMTWQNEGIWRSALSSPLSLRPCLLVARLSSSCKNMTSATVQMSMSPRQKGLDRTRHFPSFTDSWGLFCDLITTFYDISSGNNPILPTYCTI